MKKKHHKSLLVLKLTLKVDPLRLSSFPQIRKKSNEISSMYIVFANKTNRCSAEALPPISDSPILHSKQIIRMPIENFNVFE